MSLPNVTKEEWKDAEAFFEKNPTEVKYQKITPPIGHEHKRKAYAHSFVNILGIIYVLNNVQQVISEPDSDAGIFGRVKLAINKKGQTFIIKVTGIEHTQSCSPIDILMQKWGYLLQSGKTKVKAQEKEITKSLAYKSSKKVLTVFSYLGESDLITENTQVLSLSKKLTLGLNAMMNIEALHSNKALDSDIKAENFVLNGEDAILEVKSIDFDFSEKSPKEKVCIQYDKDRKGSLKYIAPEAFYLAKFSLASEVYALGITFKEMDLPKCLWKPMVVKSWKQRITLPNAMKTMASYINRHLEEDPHNEMLKKALVDYHYFKKSNYKALAIAKTEEAEEHVIFAKNLSKAALLNYAKNVIRAIVMREEEMPQGGNPLTLFKEKSKQYLNIIVIQLLLEHGLPSIAGIEGIARKMNDITQSYRHFKNSGEAKEKALQQAAKEKFTNLVEKDNFIHNKEKAILDLKLHDLSKDMKEEIFSFLKECMASILSIVDPLTELLSDVSQNQQDYIAMIVSTFYLIPLAAHPKISQNDEEKLFLRLFSTHHVSNAAALENKKLYASLYQPSCTLPNSRKQTKKPLIFRKMRGKKRAVSHLSPPICALTYQPLHRASHYNKPNHEKIHDLEQSFSQIEPMPLHSLNKEGSFSDSTPKASSAPKI